MEASVKISSKHQIVIPAKVRRELHLSSGDELLVEAVDGKIMMEPKPKSYAAHMKGLGKEIWAGRGEEHLRGERASWKD